MKNHVSLMVGLSSLPKKQHDCRRQQRVAAPEVGQKTLKLVKGGKEKQDLHDQRNDDDARAAEDDLQKASFALF